MHKEITYEWWADKCVCVLLILSMFSVVNIEIAGFPMYSMILLALASLWMMFKIIYAGRSGHPFLTVRSLTDLAAITAIAYAVFSVVVKLFSTAEEGAVDFSWNAEVIALAMICLIISSGVEFRQLYLDILLYSGLLTAGLYMFIHLTDGWMSERLAAAFTDSGQVASYFLLVSMAAVYGYCMCRDKMRSLFYIMVSGVSFFALFLNQNVVSLWLMGVFFLAIPVLLRPVAMLVKRAMQLFFLYLFMPSSMSLLTEYTQIIRKEVFYSLEHSVYLDLLIAAGGLGFFHYWDRIPEGTDLERLVLRKMQKGYRFVLKLAVMLSVALPARAQGVQTADEESTMEAMLFAQDTSDTELQVNQIQQIENSTELDAEFASLEEESVMIVEEVERQREEALRSKIWGAVIIVLVMAIFGMGIVSAVKGNKAENMETGLQGKKNRRRREQKENETEDIEIEEITE